MNWGGISVAAGLIVVAAAAGPVGWMVLVGVGVWLWRRG
jgi:hypothetical protein